MEGNRKMNIQEEGSRKAAEAKLDAYDWLEIFVVALLVCILANVFLFRQIRVDGSSMLPTLTDSERVFVSSLFYTPEQGDIIVFRKAEYKEEPLVKRVIATQGQTVDIDFNTGSVSVDGLVLDEDYILDPTYSRLDFEGPIEVPEGSVFVMGDNRNNSADSRRAAIGMVDERLIMGKVYFRIIPITKFGSVY